MSITILNRNKEEGKVSFEISNGHLEILNQITNDYKIVDIDKTLGFILAVVSKNNGRPIKIGEETFVPGEAIRIKEVKEEEIEVVEPATANP